MSMKVGAIIFGDELTIDHIVWMGDLPTIAERAERSGVTDTRPRAALADIVKSAWPRVGPCDSCRPTVPTIRSCSLGLLGLPLTALTDNASIDFIRAVVDQRAIKSDEEVGEIERAVTTSVEMHTAAIRMARPGMRESEIAAEVERIAVAAGGRISFPVIATIHGETLHNHVHGNTLAEGDLFLLDCGAETAMGYAGDLSSTFPVSPHFHDRQLTIYEIQLAAQQAAVVAWRPACPTAKSTSPPPASSPTA